MRFHCKNFKPNVNHRVSWQSRVSRRETTRTINFSIARAGTKRVKLSDTTGENTRKFTRDYGKSDGIILTRLTSWRPRLIASREFCLSSRDETLLLRERFIMEGYEWLLKVAINERR